MACLRLLLILLIASIGITSSRTQNGWKLWKKPAVSTNIEREPVLPLPAVPKPTPWLSRFKAPRQPTPQLAIVPSSRPPVGLLAGLSSCISRDAAGRASAALLAKGHACLHWCADHQQTVLSSGKVVIGVYVGVAIVRRWMAWFSSGVAEYELLLDDKDMEYQTFGGHADGMVSRVLHRISSAGNDQALPKVTAALNRPCFPAKMRRCAMETSKDLALILGDIEHKMQRGNYSDKEISALLAMQAAVSVLSARQADIYLRLVRQTVLQAANTCEDLIDHWMKHLHSSSPAMRIAFIRSILPGFVSNSSSIADAVSDLEAKKVLQHLSGRERLALLESIRGRLYEVAGKLQSHLHSMEEMVQALQAQPDGGPDGLLDAHQWGAMDSWTEQAVQLAQESLRIVSLQRIPSSSAAAQPAGQPSSATEPAPFVIPVEHLNDDNSSCVSHSITMLAQHTSHLSSQQQEGQGVVEFILPYRLQDILQHLLVPSTVLARTLHAEQKVAERVGKWESAGTPNQQIWIREVRSKQQHALFGQDTEHVFQMLSIHGANATMTSHSECGDIHFPAVNHTIRQQWVLHPHPDGTKISINFAVNASQTILHDLVLAVAEDDVRKHIAIWRQTAEAVLLNITQPASHFQLVQQVNSTLLKHSTFSTHSKHVLKSYQSSQEAFFSNLEHMNIYKRDDKGALYAVLRPRFLMRLTFWMAVVAGGLELMNKRSRRAKVFTDANTAVKELSHIFNRRLATPAKSIVNDLVFNKRTAITDKAALDDAKRSLANMIYDFLEQYYPRMSESDRKKLASSMNMSALSEEYEKELKRPLLSMANGKIARIVLIQLQFMKKEGLVAMQAIDELFNANQVNLQLLAVTPAVLALFSVQALVKTVLQAVKSASRGKQVESITVVHRDLRKLMREVERLLSSNSTESTLDATSLGKLLSMLYRMQSMLALHSNSFDSGTCLHMQEDLRDLVIPSLTVHQRLQIVDRMYRTHSFLQPQQRVFPIGFLQ